MPTITQELARLNSLSCNKQGFNVAERPIHGNNWLERYLVYSTQYYYTFLNDEEETVAIIVQFNSTLYLVLLNNTNARRQRLHPVDWVMRKELSEEGFNGFGIEPNDQLRLECRKLLESWMKKLRIK